LCQMRAEPCHCELLVESGQRSSDRDTYRFAGGGAEVAV
jgi:hypothetical protein